MALNNDSRKCVHVYVNKRHASVCMQRTLAMFLRLQLSLSETNSNMLTQAGGVRGAHAVVKQSSSATTERQAMVFRFRVVN